MNNDHKLDELEFGAFMHPEEFDHMRDIVVKETLEEMDTDKDGKVSEREYRKVEYLRIDFLRKNIIFSFLKPSFLSQRPLVPRLRRRKVISNWRRNSG